MIYIFSFKKFQCLNVFKNCCFCTNTVQCKSTFVHNTRILHVVLRLFDETTCAKSFLQLRIRCLSLAKHESGRSDPRVDHTERYRL